MWIVLNWRDVVAPNVILYNLSTGEIKYTKFKKESFKILPLVDGDIIDIQDYETRFGEKIIGKDENGINIIVADPNKELKVVSKYEIVYRNYK